MNEEELRKLMQSGFEDDDKIREWLINLVKSHIEWLEDRIKEQLSNGQVYGGELNEAKDAIAWLEKQVKQKPTDKVEPIFNVGDKIQYSKGCGIIMTVEKIENGEYIFANNMGHTTIELGNKWYLVEQKTTNNVQPKFHEGDWVFIEEVKGYKNGPFQIKIVDSFGYSFDEYHTIPFMYEDLLSKWTIQDAKDGDVLMCKDFGYTSLMLFKSFSNGRISLYCWFNSQTNHFHINTDVALRKDANIYPATKEQHDTLIKAMADAGYTFGFEKKELKKIESTNTPENFEKYVEHLLSLSDSEGHGSPAKVKEVSAELFELAKLEQKLAWSEEDEKTLNEIFSVAARASLRKSTLFGKSYDYIK